VALAEIGWRAPTPSSMGLVEPMDVHEVKWSPFQTRTQSLQPRAHKIPFVPLGSFNELSKQRQFQMISRQTKEHGQQSHVRRGNA